jgi:tetratricopeptide (TPR) repeat protein
VKIHPNDVVLEDMLLAHYGEKQGLVRHLLTCAYCRSKLGAAPREPRYLSQDADVRAVAPGCDADAAVNNHDYIAISALTAMHPRDAVDYGPAIARSERRYLDLSRALQQERSEAPALLAELLGHPAEQQRLLVANSTRYRTWGVYERLLDRSWELRTTARAQAEELARLALHLSSRLDESLYRSDLIEDLRARAWSYLGNLRRIGGDMEGAESAFRSAYDHLKRGSREPVERALYLDLKASLRGDQHRLEEASTLQRRAIDIFLHYGDEHRAGAGLINLAAFHTSAGEIEAAIPLLQQALELIDTRDERSVLCVWNNLIDDMATLGRFIEAQGLYRQARPLYRKNREIDLDLRRLWVKAKIERGLGQIESAEALLLTAQAGFLGADRPFDAALVSLELALMYAEQHRVAELKKLAAQLVPIFSARHVHCEALAALTFLTQALEAERLSAETANGVASYLRQAQGNPDLKFVAPAPNPASAT